MELPDDDPSIHFKTNTRFWIQRVFVPIMVLVGVTGNVITVMVLTRRRMRCTTNIYLTALAIADVVYLFFVLLLSFHHYPHIHEQSYELYWRFNGIIHWFCDAASNTSVWLTVSFTVERYIAVCHPMRGKVLCTENRAKSIIAIISILCIISAASTTFEYQLNINQTCVKCDPNEKPPIAPQKLTKNDHQIDIQEGFHEPSKDDMSIDNNSTLTDDQLEEGNGTANATCCVKNFWIGTESTNLGKNHTYTTIFFWFTSIMFTLLPLVLIATFNCFLVKALYESKQRRKRMTNSQEATNQSKENRITLILVGVVIMFLVCQTPTGIMVIYQNIETEDPRIQNIKLGMGNICNFLVTTNAACNFLLYCVLSKKYRSTFKKLFCERSKNRQDTLAMSLTRSRNSQKFNPNSAALKRNATYYRTPRNLEESETEATLLTEEILQPT